MELITEIAAMQAVADLHRAGGRRLALVPTMGALHEGHLALVEEAHRRADHVTVSIFVNPTQFGPNEDYSRYPRTLEADHERLKQTGWVDVVFAPFSTSMYPPAPEPHLTWIDVERLGDHLCGRYREGHFRGVTTVVGKLFNICKPHVAVFGLKDAQQFFILRRMCRELNFDVELAGVSTVREPDGLALSSRNRYLSPEQRRQSVYVARGLEAGRARIEAGERDPEAVLDAFRAELTRAPEADVQYAQVVDTEYLQPVERLAPGHEVLLAVAVFFGATRLIDNAIVRVPDA